MKLQYCNTILIYTYNYQTNIVSLFNKFIYFKENIYCINYDIIIFI